MANEGVENTKGVAWVPRTQFMPSTPPHHRYPNPGGPACAYSGILSTLNSVQCVAAKCRSNKHGNHLLEDSTPQVHWCDTTGALVRLSNTSTCTQHPLIIQHHAHIFAKQFHNQYYQQQWSHLRACPTGVCTPLEVSPSCHSMRVTLVNTPAPDINL